MSAGRGRGGASGKPCYTRQCTHEKATVQVALLINQ